MTDRQKQAFKKLGFTDEEIAEVVQADRRIDKGEKLYELDKERAKASKTARQTTALKTPTAYKFKQPKEKKTNSEKSQLIADLLKGIPYIEELNIINPEREFTFKHNGKSYKVVLSMPRS